MADKREFLVVIDGKESVSPAAGKASDSLGKLGDQAKDTERDFDGLDKKIKEHTDTITHLREEIAKTGDTKLFGELGKNERALGKLEGLKKSLVGAAEDAAPDMAMQLSGRLGPLLAKMPLSGPMAVALGGAAVIAAPLIGSVLAGAVIGGAGLGGIAGGAVIASKDARVKAAFTDLADDIGVELRQAAAPFVPALVEAADKGRAAFGRLDDDIDSIFADSAGMLDPLVDGAISGIERIIHGVKDVTSSATGAGPVIREIGNAFSIVGDAVGDVLTDLSDDGDEAAGGIRAVALATGDAIRFIGDLIEVTTAVLRPMTAFALGAANVSEKLWGWVPVIGDNIRHGRDNLIEMRDAMDQVGGATDTTTEAIEAQGSAANSTARQVELLTSALDDQVDKNLSAAEASLRYRQSVAAAAEAVDHKKAVSLQEESQLLSLAKTINEVTRATDDNGESASVAKQRYEAATQTFIDTAVKMGYTREQAAKLSNEVLKMPKAHAIKVLLNEAEAKRQVRNIQTAVNGLHGKTIRNTIITGEFGPNDIGARHGMSEGGLVGGGGPPGKDTQVRVLASDEYVLTGKEVRQAGGPGAIKQALSGGGAGGAPMGAPSAPASAGRPLVIDGSRANGLGRMFLSWLAQEIQAAGGTAVVFG